MDYAFHFRFGQKEKENGKKERKRREKVKSINVTN